MFLDKLIALLLQLKGGALTLVIVTSAAVTVTGTIGGEAVDLTITPLASPTATAPEPTLTPTASPSASPTATPTVTTIPIAAAASVTSVGCSGADARDAALEFLGDAGQEAADLLRVAGAVALANGADRNKMREMLKEYGHDIREVLKDGLHDVRDLGKRTLGECGESSVEGLVSRLEHELDEVAEVHEEFERAGSGNGSAAFVVTITDGAASLAAPYRERVEEAIEDVEDILDDLAEDIG